MKDTAESVLFVALALLVIVILPLLVLGKMRARRNRKLAAEKAAGDEQHDRTLRKPDRAAFVARYGCPPCPALQKLYESAESDLDGDFEVKVDSFPKPFFVAYFLGMSDENMSLVWPGTEGFFPFASDGSGNRYVVDPGEADPTVYFYDHEIQKRESVKMSLSRFLAAKRTKSKW